MPKKIKMRGFICCVCGEVFPDKIFSNKKRCPEYQHDFDMIGKIDKNIFDDIRKIKDEINKKKVSG